MEMKGARVEWPDGLLNPGEYAKHLADGYWYAMTPNGHLANLSAHVVTEHEDGSITVSPSILVRLPETALGDVFNRDGRHEGQLWHGFLERGVWREC